MVLFTISIVLGASELKKSSNSDIVWINRPNK